LNKGNYFHEMKFNLAIILAIICFALIAIGRLFVGPPLPGKEIIASPETTYISRGNIFEGFFREPVETVLIILRDGRYYGLTSFQDNQVAIAPGLFFDWLQKNNIAVSDIYFITHNHFGIEGFSQEDGSFYYALKNRGFKGTFAIYYPMSKTIRIKEK